jgi:predicted MFS family arabinose efflux permease
MLKLIAVWCEESRFASILGLAMLIGNVGSVLAGAPLAWAAQASSWRVVFAVIALLSLGIAIASWYRVVDSPHGDSRHRIDRGAWLAGLASVVRNPATWPGFFVNFGIGGSFFAFAGLWAVPYLTQVHGMTRTVAANHVSLYFLAFAIGCLFVGSLSDRIGRRKPVMLLGSTLYCASWLSWLSGADLSGVGSYSVCAAMGLFTASLTLSWACAKEVNSPLLSGMATSVVNVGVFLGAAVFQPLVGWAMDRGWDGALIEGARAYSPAAYRTGLVLMMGAAFFGALATLFVRETRCRNIWREANGSPR